MCSLCLQGSDIETLGSEAVVEYGAELLERPLVEETKLQDTKAAASAGKNPHIIILAISIIILLFYQVLYLRVMFLVLLLLLLLML